MADITDHRLKHLRTSAEVGIRLGMLTGPKTVHVDPAELLALVDRVEQLAHDVQRLRAEREQLVIENHVLTRKIAELRDRD
jgi:hypothetical protein